MPLIFILVFCCHVVAQPVARLLQGKVIAVKDGDTIELLYNGKPVTIRLAHIDCPEIRGGQPFGKVAKKFTSDYCFGQVVSVETNGKRDRNKRVIGIVLNAHAGNLNRALLAAGLAWHFKKYSTDESYDQLERIARKNKIGIWSVNNPVAPWDWRQHKR